MTSCVTNQTPGIFLWASESECSGHGTCVTAPSGRSLCECDAGWSGGNDWFDLRVEYAGGKTYSLDCSNNVVGVQAVWAVLFAALIFRFLVNIYAFLVHFRNKNGFLPGGLYVNAAYMPYRVLLLDIIIGSPLLFSWLVQKMISGEYVLGTTVSTTVLFALSVVCLQVQIWDFYLAQFKVLVGASNFNQLSDGAKKLLRDYTFITVAQGIVYVGISLIPSLCALALDKTLGPIDNYEFIIIIFRNAGVLIWMCIQLVTSVYIEKVASKLKSSLGGGSGSKGSGSKVSNILDFLHVQQVRYRIQSFVGVLAYLPGLLPWLWPYQSFILGVAMVFGGFGASTGLILLRSWNAAKKKKQPTVPTSGSEEKKQALAVTMDSSVAGGRSSM